MWKEWRIRRGKVRWHRILAKDLRLHEYEQECTTTIVRFSAVEEVYCWTNQRDYDKREVGRDVSYLSMILRR